MMRRRSTFLLGIALGLMAYPGLEVRGQSPARPFPQHTAYAAGTIRPSNHSQVVLDDDVRAAYGRWKSNYLAQAGTEPDGHPRYRILTNVETPGDTVSEGQGYGMVIVARMAGYDSNAQTIYDGLWEFFNDHRSTIDNRLMDWHVPPDESAEPGDDDSAFDGDCDIVFSLLLADAQWGSGGRIDYRTQFNTMIAGVLANTIGPQSRIPLLGDWVNPAGTQYNQYTNRTSDFMPDHFRAFETYTGDSAWEDVRLACLSAVQSLQSNYAATTGLLPDFLVPVSASNHSPKPAPPGFLEGPTDGYYSYNAGRDPWRYGADAALTGDANSADVALKITRWAQQKTGGNPLVFRAGYKLDGSNITNTNYFSSFFVAPLGVAALSDAALQSWLNAIYDAVRTDHEGYYEDTVTLQCMITMSGNDWLPSPTCLGDLNSDRQVDLSDLAIQLSHYGLAHATPAQGDLDGNQVIDLADLALMLSRYGLPCP